MAARSSSRGRRSLLPVPRPLPAPLPAGDPRPPACLPPSPTRAAPGGAGLTPHDSGAAGGSGRGQHRWAHPPPHPLHTPAPCGQGRGAPAAHKRTAAPGHPTLAGLRHGAVNGQCPGSAAPPIPCVRQEGNSDSSDFPGAVLLLRAAHTIAVILQLDLRLGNTTSFPSVCRRPCKHDNKGCVAPPVKITYRQYSRRARRAGRSVLKAQWGIWHVAIKCSYRFYTSANPKQYSEIIY